MKIKDDIDKFNIQIFHENKGDIQIFHENKGDINIQIFHENMWHIDR